MTRKWMDLVVGLCLTLILCAGGFQIYQLNEDAREVDLSGELAMRGQEISTAEGCIACHTVDGSTGIGPTWLGMWGKSEVMKDGRQVVVDEEYFREAINYPAAKVVDGYPNVMLRYFFDDEEMEALIAFARQLSEAP